MLPKRSVGGGARVAHALWVFMPGASQDLFLWCASPPFPTVERLRDNFSGRRREVALSRKGIE
jgi:hypothetical protein